MSTHHAALTSIPQRATPACRALTLRIFVAACVSIVGTAAVAEPVRVVLLSPPDQTAPPGQLVPMPFRFRVERTNGEPVPGVLVWYGTSLDCPSDPYCVTEEEIGAFEPGYPDGPLFVMVTTGSDGTATTPRYRVGIPQPEPVDLPVGFFFSAIVESQTTPGGIVIDNVVDDVGLAFVLIGGLAALPALGDAGFVTLVTLLAAAGLWRIRHRNTYANGAERSSTRKNFRTQIR